MRIECPFCRNEIELETISKPCPSLAEWPPSKTMKDLPPKVLETFRSFALSLKAAHCHQTLKQKDMKEKSEVTNIPTWLFFPKYGDAHWKSMLPGRPIFWLQMHRWNPIMAKRKTSPKLADFVS